MIQKIKNFRYGIPLLILIAAFALGLGSMAGFSLKRGSSPASALPSSPSAPPSPTAIISADADKDKIPEESKAAVKAIKQFLTATTVEERLRFALRPDAMKPQMERYYQQISQAPVTVDRIEFVRMDPNPEIGSGRHCILNLESKDWEFSVPVMLEEEPDGFKVDWQSFVEFKDRMLEKFFQTCPKEPTRFHVGIQRVHYFEDGVPDLSGKDCFRVSPAPPNSFQGHVFLEKNSELAKELREHLPWETHLWVVVELECKKQGAQQWVELKEMPQMHWYLMPVSPNR